MTGTAHFFLAKMAIASRTVAVLVCVASSLLLVLSASNTVHTRLHLEVRELDI